MFDTDENLEDLKKFLENDPEEDPDDGEDDEVGNTCITFYCHVTIKSWSNRALAICNLQIL